MTNKLEQAARLKEVEDYLRDCANSPVMAAKVAALREALAEQAEQKPVALIEECREALAQELMAYDIDPPIHHVKQAHDKCVAWLSNHAAPVRTKDLTDDEIVYLWNWATSEIDFARAVIAADREKNRG